MINNDVAAVTIYIIAVATQTISLDTTLNLLSLPNHSLYDLNMSNTTVKQLSLQDYQTSLKGGSVTCEWDVIVCYTARELNALLNMQWAALDLKIPLSKTYPCGPYSIIYTFDIHLGAPILQFKASNEGRVALDAP